MTIQWLGHACFRLEAQGYAIVLDPYRDGTVPGLRPLRAMANEVLCSHQHDDHGYVQAVTLQKATQPSPFTVTRVDSFHDDAGGAKRGRNTIHVLEAGGIRVCHLGDLGHTLDDAQIHAIGRVDVLLLPVGGFYTIDAPTAKAVAASLGAQVIIPMHYRTDAAGLAAIDTLESFLDLCDTIDYAASDTVIIGTQERPRVLVLAYQ